MAVEVSRYIRGKPAQVCGGILGDDRVMVECCMRENYGQRRVLLVAMLCAAIVGGAAAQGNAATADVEARAPAFDVVSIRPNKSGSGRMSINENNDSFSAENITLKDMLVNAYDVKEYLISGLTGWANSAHFDINAKIVDMDAAALKKLTDKQRDAMLQQLLADRFHLKVHRQTDVLPIYEMVMAKGGAKITAVEPVGPDPDADENKNFKGMGRGSMRVSNTEMMAHDVPLDSLAYMLSGRLSRTVVDKTGLKGKYDLSLTWSPDDGSTAASDSSAPSLFTALQEQLGLKLQPAKGPVETLVVDHVEMPSEN
jgi:uncharacterized protein (TIGR03435 family)